MQAASSKPSVTNEPTHEPGSTDEHKTTGSAKAEAGIQPLSKAALKGQFASKGRPDC